MKIVTRSHSDMQARFDADSAGFVEGREKTILIASMAVVFFVLALLYSAVLGVLLPNQVQQIDSTGKAQALGTILAITAVFSTLTTPIAGALSDRTFTRLGQRGPWIVLGGVGGAISLALVPIMNNLAAITLFWVVAAILLNSMQPAVTALVADRFAPAERGVTAGVVGASFTAGLSGGLIFGGLWANQLAAAYWVCSAGVAGACMLFVLINPEPRLHRPKPTPFRLGRFLRGFWIDPRQHPDFAWAFMGRFVIYMGYQAVIAYLLYILQDHIGLSKSDANMAIAKLSSITFVALVASGLISGWLSDRLGRRKPMVFAASLTMAAAVILPLLLPTMDGMICYAVLIGLGYGAFMSVDLALMTQVLPQRADGATDTGKDLGILTTAVNIPQILSPVMAAWLLAAFHGDYRALFIVAGVFVTIGSFLVLPIRSVR